MHSLLKKILWQRLLATDEKRRKGAWSKLVLVFTINFPSFVTLVGSANNVF